MDRPTPQLRFILAQEMLSLLRSPGQLLAGSLGLAFILGTLAFLSILFHESSRGESSRNALSRTNLAIPSNAKNPIASLPLPILFNEDFSDPGSGWQQVTSPAGETRYQNGRYEITIKSPNFVVWGLSGRDFDNFVMEVSGHQEQGSADGAYGLIFRYQNDQNFYELDVSTDGFVTLGRYQNNTWTALIDWTPNSAINLGAATNHLRIEARGPHFVVYVNNNPIGKVDDHTFTQGDIGLVAGSRESGARVLFDYLRVYNLPELP